MRIHWIVAGVAWVWLGVCAEGHALLQSDALPVLKARKPVTSTIEDGDRTVISDRIKQAYTDATVIGKRFRIEFSKAGTYTFDLRSPYFDSYLVLRDSTGELVAEDDDGLVSVHARIVVQLEAGKAYHLDACALHGQRGSFDLNMTKGEPAPGQGIEWTDEEVDLRLKIVFSEEMWKKVKVVKSKHYLIFTDGSSGKKFGKILDKEIYGGFKKLFPFEKPDNVRLMPIYLFNTREGYIDFLMRYLDMEQGQAERTGGIQYQDFYSTSYSSPRDPTHFHECAHQIMSTIFRLNGGGSWYQEGIAEYYEDKINKFNREAETRMAIRTDQSVSWKDLLTAESMLFSAGENKKGGGGARGNYGLAASVILFLKEGAHKKLFDDFLQKMGKVPRSDLDAIEAVFQEVYGKTSSELEQEWLEFFAG